MSRIPPVFLSCRRRLRPPIRPSAAVTGQIDEGGRDDSGGGPMTDAQLSALLDELLALDDETEWVECKHNNAEPGA